MIFKQAIILLFILIGTTQVFSKAYENNFSNGLHATSQTNQFIKKRIQHNQLDSIGNAQKSYVSERFSSRKKIQNENISNQNGFNLQSEQFGRARFRSSGNGSFVSTLILGGVIFFAGFPTLWYNEKSYAFTKSYLRKYYKICKSVDSARIDPQNEKKLVCVSGDTQTNEQLIDPKFDVKVNNSIRLTRKCEMYQWIEEKNTSTNDYDQEEVYYTYSLEWRDEYIQNRNYSRFYEHSNYQFCWLYDNETFNASNVTYGAYKLTELQKNQCQKEEVIPVNTNMVNLIASNKYFIANNTHQSLSENNQTQQSDAPLAQLTQNSAILQQSVQVVPGNPPPGSKTLVVQDNYIYFRKLATTNSPGDFRIRFIKTPCGPITVVGEQSFSAIETFRPEECRKQEDVNSNYDNDNNDQEECGCSAVFKYCKAINTPNREINWVVEEKCKRKNVFLKQVTHSETMKTWKMRLIGLCCFSVGIWLMFARLYRLLYWFPFVGRYLAALGSFICLFVGFFIAIPLSIFVIGVAWLYYRIVIGIPLICVSLLIIGYFIYSCQNES